MITLKTGFKDHPPYVEVEITTGIFPGYYWYEVSYWSKKDQCFIHDWEKDGGAFGLWFVLKKAERAMYNTWAELLEKYTLIMK